MELSVENLYKHEKQESDQTTSFCIPGGSNGVSATADHPEYKMAASNENLLMITTREGIYQTREKSNSPNSNTSGSSFDSTEIQSLDEGVEDFDNHLTELDYGLIHTEVIELKRDKIVWETHHVALKSVDGLGFGFAVSGGADNPHFSSGETTIAVSDVLKGGPADGILKPNDRVISINDMLLEDCYHREAITLLRNCGNMADMVIKRKVYVPSPHSRQEKSVVLENRNGNYKDMGHGLELGCKIYIKNIKPGSTGDVNAEIEQGDFILKVNNKDTENMTLTQTQKLIQQTRGGRLKLTLERPPKPLSSKSRSGSHYESALSLYDTEDYRVRSGSSGYASPYGLTGRCTDFSRVRAGSRLDVSEDDLHFAAFEKQQNGSTGIEIAGGNSTGVFVSNVLSGGNAQASGVREGDQIFKINGVSVTGLTRQEVMMRLTSIPHSVELLLANKPSEYSELFTNSDTLCGDELFIRSNVSYMPKNSEKDLRLTMNPGDVFKVIDTLPEDSKGSWMAIKMTRDGNELELGLIPNKSVACTLSSTNTNHLIKNTSRDHLHQLLDDKVSHKDQPYEKVLLKTADFPRPVALYGALSELCRDKLVSMYPAQFEIPHSTRVKSGLRYKSMVQTSSIEAVLIRGKHCLLDLPPHAAHKLQTDTGLHPIVMHVTSDTAELTDVKTARGMTKEDEFTDRITSCYPDLITAKINVTRGRAWLQQVCDVIEKEQGKKVWMSADNSSSTAGLTIGDYLSLGSSRAASRENLYTSALFGGIPAISSNSINNLASDLQNFSGLPRGRSRAMSETPSPDLVNRNRSSTNPDMSYKLKSALSRLPSRVEKLESRKVTREPDQSVNPPVSQRRFVYQRNRSNTSPASSNHRTSQEFVNRAFVDDENTTSDVRERSSSTSPTRSYKPVIEKKRPTSGIWFTDRSHDLH